MVKNIYIHIPFCKNICSYCDFCKMYYISDKVDEYLKSLEKEIKENYKNEEVSTIYIGGGTPSCLNDSQLKKLFNILNIINKDKLEEFTIELNPEDINEAKLKILSDNGINRVSIGFQTKNRRILNLMERKSINFKEKIDIVKKYIKNINVDLIYGFKEQTFDDLKEDLEYIISLDINHISTYSLILEEHTKLYISNYSKVDEDTDYLFYQKIIEFLKNNKFNHYEISNFSKEGFESKHNLCYWKNNEYYGFGLGASGYINDIRYTNTKNFNKYINYNYEKDIEQLSLRDKKQYEMITGLRLINGVDKDEYLNKYNCDISDDFDYKDLVNKGYLIEDKKSLKVSEKYLYQENTILTNFID